jgi:lysophospholipase L1-like esterase
LKPAAANLLLVAFATLVGLVALEGAVRVRVALTAEPSFEEVSARRAPVVPGAKATLGQLLRPTGDRRIYELVPGLEVNFAGRHVVVNAEGFRGPSRPVSKPAGASRIVGLGDSVMFGWGVDEGEDYLSVLVARLNGRGAAWDVINTAVPGYNTVMEVETLKARGLAYAPDVVVLGYCVNDLELPPFLGDPPDPFTLRRSFLKDFVASRVWPEQTRQRATGRYADMVGFAAFTKAAKELSALSQAHGFRVVVLFFWSAPPEIKRIVEGLGFELVYTRAAMKAYMDREGIKELRGSKLSLTPEDSHPSVIGHGLMAESLEAAIAPVPPVK